MKQPPPSEGNPRVLNPVPGHWRVRAGTSGYEEGTKRHEIVQCRVRKGADTRSRDTLHSARVGTARPCVSADTERCPRDPGFHRGDVKACLGRPNRVVNGQVRPNRGAMHPTTGSRGTPHAPRLHRVHRWPAA
jgi:hypothetical protein